MGQKNNFTAKFALPLLLGIAVFSLLHIIYGTMPWLGIPTTYFAILVIALLPYAYMLSRMDEGILRAVFCILSATYLPFLPILLQERIPKPQFPIDAPLVLLALFFFLLLLFYPKLKIRKYVPLKTILTLAAPAMLVYCLLPFLAGGQVNGLPGESWQAWFYAVMVPFMLWWAFLASLTGLMMRPENKTRKPDFLKPTKRKLYAMLAIFVLALAVVLSGNIASQAYEKLPWLGKISTLLLCYAFLPPIALMIYLGFSGVLAISLVFFAFPISGESLAAAVPGIFLPLGAVAVVLHIYVTVCAVFQLAKDIREWLAQPPAAP